MYTSRKWSSTAVEGVVISAFVLFFVANHDCTVWTMQRKPEQIKTNMTRHKIVPDVIDTFPEMSILMRYSEFVNADLGNELKYEDIEEYVPLISWKYEEGKYYTLMMLDPDSPTEQNPTKRSWVHWIVGNIPDHHVMEGEHIIEYQETRPANGTGFHRYVAMIFKQPQGKINFNESHIHQFNQNDENVRAKFSATKFAEKYKLGKPLGINFFRANGPTSIFTIMKMMMSKRVFPQMTFTLLKNTNVTTEYVFRCR